MFLLTFYFSKVWKVLWFYIKRLVVKPDKKQHITNQINVLKKDLFFNKIIQICVAGFIPISISVYFQFKGMIDRNLIF